MSAPLTADDLAAFNAELTALVRAGVPLEPGLSALGREQRGRLGRLSAGVASRMRQGLPLDEALAAAGSEVPRAYGAIVRAGLKSGRLPAALETMTTLALELSDLRRKIGQSLLQPLILLVLAYILLIVFGVDLLERYRETFVSLEVVPPRALTWLFEAAPWVAAYWWVGPLLFLGCLGAWRLSGRTGLLSLSGWSTVLAWVPGVSAIARNYRDAGFAQLLALLCEHEVPLPEGIRLAAEATGDPGLKARAQKLALATERGKAPGNRDGWPRFLHWTLTRGVQHGGLPRLLKHSAAVSRSRARMYSIWLQSLLPIVFLVGLGGVVVLLHAAVNLGPMTVLWFHLGQN